MKIIAEVGSNWKTKEDCIQSIHLAKAHGADAVKFQLFDGLSFYYKAIYKEDSLPLHWLPELKEQANRESIEFMCSAFSPHYLSEVDKYVDTHKMASAEMCHIEMLDILRDLKKPVILSTGGHSTNEIRQAIARLEGCPITLMYCIASYPAKHTNPHKITRMKELYGLPIGLSDHSQEVYSVPEMAQSLGASVLEKHVNFSGVVSADSPHSLSETEFFKMVKHLKEPIPIDHHDPEEIEMLTKHHRRLIATQDISIGDKFRLNWNFGIYRSDQYDTHGYNPFMTEFVRDKLALKNIPAGKSIGPGDF